jgi:hypothetical protein
VNLGATPVEIFCARAAPESVSVYAPFRDVNVVRPPEENWGLYITAKNYTAGDTLKCTIFYTFECRVKPGVKMIPVTPPIATGDSEMVIPASTAGNFPFVRRVEVRQ